MYLSDFENVVSSLAVITTILQFLSGALVCKQYVVNRTTAETSSLPFVCSILCCCLWFLYGLVKHDNIIILVNTIGVSLMISYTAVFYIYTFKKSTVLKQVVGAVAFVIFILCYAVTEHDKAVLFSTLGLMACSFTILTIAAPMSKLLYVLRVKSTECLPFPMILMSFFVSMLWFLYGTIKDDNFLWSFIYISNKVSKIIVPKKLFTNLLRICLVLHWLLFNSLYLLYTQTNHNHQAQLKIL